MTDSGFRRDTKCSEIFKVNWSPSECKFWYLKNSACYFLHCILSVNSTDLQNQIMQSEIPLGLYSPTPNPPSSQDLPEPRFQLRPPRSIQRPSLGQMFPPSMMPYGPMMYPSMMGMQPQYVQSAGSFGINSAVISESSVTKKQSNPAQYIKVSLYGLYVLLVFVKRSDS